MKVYRDPPTENVIILVVIVTWRGPHPMYEYLDRDTS